ncbi:hypothetical protein [Halopseudomonas pelagia]
MNAIELLKELLEHHIEEEEMFKEAAKLLSKNQLNELGEMAWQGP